jgi:methionyl aminopeptidase
MEEYKKAGRIAAKAKKYAEKLVKPGEKILDIAEKLEQFIRDAGGEPAFPVNIGINNIAAHYTPERNDAQEIKDNDVVKIDVGVHINGFIADTAITINPSKKFKPLIDACESALQKAIELAKPGTTFGEIGKAIEEEIRKAKFFPIKNLGGHYLEQYVQHTGEIIPNFNNFNKKQLKEGDVIAIEPFASTQGELVSEYGRGNIYKYEHGNVRTPIERKLLEKIRNYRGMPFTSRWFKEYPLETLLFFFGKMSNIGILHSYPVLVGKENSIIAQAEHTIIIDEKPIIVTK